MRIYPFYMSVREIGQTVSIIVGKTQNKGATGDGRQVKVAGICKNAGTLTKHMSTHQWALDNLFFIHYTIL